MTSWCWMVGKLTRFWSMLGRIDALGRGLWRRSFTSEFRSIVNRVGSVCASPMCPLVVAVLDGPISGTRLLHEARSRTGCARSRRPSTALLEAASGTCRGLRTTRTSTSRQAQCCWRCAGVVDGSSSFWRASIRRGAARHPLPSLPARAALPPSLVTAPQPSNSRRASVVRCTSSALLELLQSSSPALLRGLSACLLRLADGHPTSPHLKRILSAICEVCQPLLRVLFRSPSPSVLRLAG